MSTTNVTQTNGLGFNLTHRIAHILGTFRTELAPKLRTGSISTLNNGSGISRVPVKAQAQIAEAEQTLRDLDVLLGDAFKGGSLTQTIQPTQKGLDDLARLTGPEKLARKEQGITAFEHVTQSSYGSFLLQTDTGLDVESKELVTNVSVIKIGEDGGVKDFTLPELRKLQSYNISIANHGKSSGPVKLDLPGAENYFISAQLRLPTDEIKPEKIYAVKVDFASATAAGNGQKVQATAQVASNTEGAGLQDLSRLIEEVFLKKGSVNQELKDTLSDLGELIRTKTYNEDAVFRKQLGNYEVTVKGQRPKTPGKNVVLVVDFDKVDSSKFTDPEKDLLRSYPIQLHYEDASSNGALQDAWSPEVVLSEREDSMSAGFWAEYRGQGINLKLYYDRFKEQEKWIRYESEVARIQTPTGVNNPNKIVLNLQTS